MARRRKSKSKIRREFAHAAHICSERARRGLERYQDCIARHMRGK